MPAINTLFPRDPACQRARVRRWSPLDALLRSREEGKTARETLPRVALSRRASCFFKTHIQIPKCVWAKFRDWPRKKNKARASAFDWPVRRTCLFPSTSTNRTKYLWQEKKKEGKREKGKKRTENPDWDSPQSHTTYMTCPAERFLSLALSLSRSSPCIILCLITPQRLRERERDY